MITFRKVSIPNGLGNGFGRSNADYAIYQSGRRVGYIDGIGRGHWSVRLTGVAGARTCYTLSEAKAKAVALLTPPA